jgi:hypothetical protein
MTLRNLLFCWAKTYIANREFEAANGGPPSPDFTIGDHQLERWWVFRSKLLGGIYIHRFNASDEGRALHDHPWASLGLILGPVGYADVTDENPICGTYARWRDVGSWTFRWPSRPHRVELLTRDQAGALIPVYTLFFIGPEVREWGFHCPNGWRPWQEFVARDYTDNQNRIGKGCG